jgi:hypothetical protein
MIIDSDRAEDTLKGMEFIKDGRYIHHHVQDTSLIQEACQKERQAGNNGFTDDKGFRKIASIAPLDAVRLQAERPGFFSSPEMIKEWLKTEEGERFLTVKRNSI